jgi:glycosyltransferase involved in cell wall biosynthesis
MKRTVGVVMAAYNGERFIEEQLQSILDQTLRPNRIVITDDASTDGTSEIVRRHARQNPSIVFFPNDRNIGYVKNFEKGISLCDADFIALSDQDDIWKPEKLEACVDALSSSPEAGLCYHNSHLIYEDGRLLDANLWEVSRHMFPLETRRAREIILGTESPIAGFAMVFHRSLKAHLLRMPGFRLCGHDWWICGVAFFLFQPVWVETPLSYYRMHGSQASGASSWLLSGTKYAIKKKLFDPGRIRRNIEREIYRAFNRKKIKEARADDRKKRSAEFDGALDRLAALLGESGTGLPDRERREMIQDIARQQERLQKNFAR